MIDSKHIGEKATVCGKMIDTFPYSGMTILGMGAAVMEPGAVGIEVPDSTKSSLDKDFYVGKTICVTGEKNPVKTYKKSGTEIGSCRSNDPM